MNALFAVFFYLMIGHALCDYVLQSERMSHSKRRKNNPKDWWLTLGAHAIMHGGAVSLVLASPLLGFFEFLAYFVSDFSAVKRSTHIGPTNCFTSPAKFFGFFSLLLELNNLYLRHFHP